MFYDCPLYHGNASGLVKMDMKIHDTADIITIDEGLSVLDVMQDLADMPYVLQK